LWALLPAATATRFYNDAKEGLETLWLQHYKGREIPNEPQPQIPADRNRNIIRRKRQRATNRQPATSQFSSSQATSSQSQHSLRNRGRPPHPHRHRPEVPLDELTQYLKEPVIDEELFDDDPIKWWRDVGAKRFPRLSYLASDLLSIPSSTATVERQFNSAGGMVTPLRNRLGRVIIGQAQSLKMWRRQQIYRASDHWRQALPD
jgi:hypothetical protein